MALKDIIDSITKDADVEAATIRDAGDKQLQHRKQKLDAIVQRAQEDASREADDAAKRKVEQEQFLHRTSTRNIELEKRHELIDTVFADAVQALEQLPPAEHEAFLAKIIVELPEDTDGVIVPTASAKSLLPSALAAAKRTIQIDGETVGGGGFVYRTKTLEIDCRFATLVEKSRPVTLPQVATELFG